MVQANTLNAFVDEGLATLDPWCSKKARWLETPNLRAKDGCVEKKV